MKQIVPFIFQGSNQQGVHISTLGLSFATPQWGHVHMQYIQEHCNVPYLSSFIWSHIMFYCSKTNLIHLVFSGKRNVACSSSLSQVNIYISLMWRFFCLLMPLQCGDLMNYFISLEEHHEFVQGSILSHQKVEDFQSSGESLFINISTSIRCGPF